MVMPTSWIQPKTDMLANYQSTQNNMLITPFAYCCFIKLQLPCAPYPCLTSSILMALSWLLPAESLLPPYLPFLRQLLWRRADCINRGWKEVNRQSHAILQAAKPERQSYRLYTGKTRPGIPVGRPLLMQLHHLTKSSWFGKINVTFEPMMQF